MEEKKKQSIHGDNKHYIYFGKQQYRLDQLYFENHNKVEFLAFYYTSQLKVFNQFYFFLMVIITLDPDGVDAS